MSKKIDSILEEILKGVSPNKEDLRVMEDELKKFLKELEKEIKKNKIDVKIFIGGSFAKKTLIKKEIYDADIFLRFSKKYKDKDLTKLTQKILHKFKNKFIVHGSRDYFKIKISPTFYLEIVPVLRIKKPEEAKNITDLSYSHVNYIKKKIKNRNILDQIKISKLFFQANGFYGAESYIKGFSGYATELLMVYYKTFENMLKEVSKAKDKIIIDIEKTYKNKKQILRDINESKLESPIILIDPTHKYRNVLAALSESTFKKFVIESKKFLKSPSVTYFQKKKINLKAIKENSKKKGYEFILLECSTEKQEGDIAGTKLLKFYNHLSNQIEEYFEIKNKGFNYNGKKSARFFIVVRKRKEKILRGPLSKDKKNVAKFKKLHKKTFTKNGRIYSREKINFNLERFILNWKKKRAERIKEMYIKNLRVVD
jgi:tRNA nucleotidyltransferase (CCA-adding enzyme)